MTYWQKDIITCIILVMWNIPVIRKPSMILSTIIHIYLCFALEIWYKEAVTVFLNFHYDKIWQWHLNLVGMILNRLYLLNKNKVKEDTCKVYIGRPGLHKEIFLKYLICETLFIWYMVLSLTFWLIFDIICIVYSNVI